MKGNKINKLIGIFLATILISGCNQGQGESQGVSTSSQNIESSSQTTSSKENSSSNYNLILCKLMYKLKHK